MRTANIIAAEIVELSEIKAAYNHFLASHMSQVEIENTTFVSRNKIILTQNLKALYHELEYARQRESAAGTAKRANMQWVQYRYSPQVENAILHFNADRRYSITE